MFVNIIRMKKELTVNCRDFDPCKDLPNERDQKFFNLGFEYAIKQFNQKMTGSYYNDNLPQKENETTEQYISRLKNDFIELLCSNRGYASCFTK